ncbi:LysE/ArgO family amino acid transporter [Sneathiella aquimaris]|uniref:LysE/ArgO family amino acid transporter n=1 Tax=Sneathiella aquimaris TaxID=2599305 RepID=UPI00146D45AE|nr:LysE family transporter [Sneathiella aquimaris]
MSIAAFANGALLGGALIIAIGAQNLFVLRQGIARDQVFIVCLICSLIDGTLIAAGALGLGTLIATLPWLVTLASWGGVAFLLIFGGMALFRVFVPKPVDTSVDEPPTSSVKKAIMLTLAFGLLNPHVYLDTVILLGGIASAYAFDLRLFFVAGAVLVSFAWFFFLGYGARLMAPLMKHPAGARFLDLLVAVMMFAVAASLVHDQMIKGAF